MVTKLFLSAGGLLYLGLAIYCMAAPEKASRTVHLEPQGPGGQSEFLVVYGGLELALAVVFLLPWTGVLPGRQALVVFLVVHAMYGPLPSSTQELAIGEWVLLLSGLLVLWLSR